MAFCTIALLFLIFPLNLQKWKKVQFLLGIACKSKTEYNDTGEVYKSLGEKKQKVTFSFSNCTMP